MQNQIQILLQDIITNLQKAHLNSIPQSDFCKHFSSEGYNFVSRGRRATKHDSNIIAIISLAKLPCCCCCLPIEGLAPTSLVWMFSQLSEKHQDINHYVLIIREEIILAKLKEKFHLDTFTVLKVCSTALLTRLLYSITPNTFSEEGPASSSEAFQQKLYQVVSASHQLILL